jgi:outer membrane protein
MKTTTSIGPIFAALGLLACSATSAQEDNTLRVGMYAIFYHAASTDLSGPFVPTGVHADVGDVQTVYLAYIRRLSAHFDLEVAAGVPPKTDTIAKGPAKVGSVPLNGQVIGTVKWIAPTALLHYKFLDESAALRPYVGLGINFTHFADRQINANGQAALGGPTSASLTNSIGPAATVGLYYHVINHWSAIASFSASEVASHVTLRTEGVVRKTYVSFNPQALVFAVGYSF